MQPLNVVTSLLFFFIISRDEPTVLPTQVPTKLPLAIESPFTFVLFMLHVHHHNGINAIV